ncbi:uncharacterized protein LOC120697063 isoform X2 [Panicum virgatum]|uniref:uncharacterized protein LOC120697063 isoform X2 n=1 Tax=Panicum virgatum TaxID=38727 RepID=UPI0019D5096B|nr:uncharacterized protein LOC120697063 isoform X2 [Panicum virgatum]
MAASAKVARLTTLALFSRTPTPSGPKPINPRARTPPPISISMDPALVDPAHLQALMLACAHSCALRLSPAAPASPVQPVDLGKLRTAIAHSFIVVSVFCGASDFQVHPSLQRRGIGRKIVEKITRVLHSRGIYDISALCTEKERYSIHRNWSFFEACGFGDDIMGSTTMLYTRNVQMLYNKNTHK